MGPRTPSSQGLRSHEANGHRLDCHLGHGNVGTIRSVPQTEACGAS